MKRFRGGLIFEAHRLCESLNSRLESDEEEKRSMVGRGKVGTTVRAVAKVLWTMSADSISHKTRRSISGRQLEHGGLVLRLMDDRFTHHKAQGPSRTWN